MSMPRSRRPSDAVKAHHLRSFATESTLAESYDEADGDGSQMAKSDIGSATIEEDEEEPPSTPSRKKRFSASEVDAPQDGMIAVDEGISQKSEKIAQKVLQIEQKLETALASDRRVKKWRDYSANGGSEEEAVSVRSQSRSSKGPRKTRTKNRNRSGTASSTQTGTSVHTDEGTASTISHPRSLLVVPGDQGNKTPTRRTFNPDGQDEETTAMPVAMRTIPAELSAKSSKSRSAPTGTSPVSATDDSDTDFQSAYSTSPRESYGSFENGEGDDEPVGLAPSAPRERVSSTATAIQSSRHAISTPA